MALFNKEYIFEQNSSHAAALALIFLLKHKNKI